MKILICDDNNDDIEIIKKDLEKYSFDIDTKNDINDIKTRYDIVFMDIEFNSDKNGIDYVKDNFNNSEVIYITGYSQYCTKVYETDHIYFLLKPYNKKDFHNAVNKAINNIKEKRKNILIIKNKSEDIRINVDDIYYIESDRRIINIITNKDNYETYNTLKKIINYLPKQFIICHNSFIINIKKVKIINKSSFVMDNNEIIPISQKKYKYSKEVFLNFIGGINE